MTTRFFLTVTLNADESEAPVDWEQESGVFSEIGNFISQGFTSGEVSIYADERNFRAFWELKPEDD